MIAKTVTNPLERIKMLSQTGEVAMTSGRGGQSATNLVDIYRTILQREGIMGLWAGNGANLLRVFPSKAVVFSSHDFYQSFLVRRFGSAESQSNVSDGIPVATYFSFISGGLAGMTASAVTYPLDLVRGRISGKMAVGTSPQNSQKDYRGVWQTLRLTLHDEGVRGLYKGIAPTLIGAMPYVGIQFGTVGLLERLIPLKSDARNGDSTASSPLRKMLFGGCGGLMAGLLTYPNDTIRRLLQLQGSRGTESSYEGYWDCVRQTYRKEGVRRFYRGLGVNLLRMVPNTAVQFGCYELLKQWTA